MPIDPITGYVIECNSCRARLDDGDGCDLIFLSEQGARKAISELDDINDLNGPNEAVWSRIDPNILGLITSELDVVGKSALCPTCTAILL